MDMDLLVEVHRSEEDKRLLTTKPHESDLHVVPMSCINFKHMATCLSMSKGRRAGGYKTVIGIRPTGWTFSGGAQGRGARQGDQQRVERAMEVVDGVGEMRNNGVGGRERLKEGVEKALGVSLLDLAVPLVSLAPWIGIGCAYQVVLSGCAYARLRHIRECDTYRSFFFGHLDR